MSLSRDDWAKMWQYIKVIEANAKMLKSPPTRQNILYEVKNIKELIQKVVGQME